MKIYSAHNPNETIRKLSSSGGVFSTLVEKIIAEGGVVYGAAFDGNWNVVHKRIFNVNQLNELRGSKYVYSNTTKAYSDALEDLAEGKTVLFSGTPCQIAAMKKRAGEEENLLLVEVVCHGAPKPEYWQRYLGEQCEKLKNSVENINSISFRDKRTGWKNYSFTIQFSDGTELSQLHGLNIYMRGFLLNYTLRNACFRCPFKYPNGSKADITLGDFWGIDRYNPDMANDLGTTLIITQNDKGDKYINSFQALKDLSIEGISIYNRAITECARAPKDYKKFQKSAAASKHIISVIEKYTREPFLLRIKIFVKSLIAR